MATHRPNDIKIAKYFKLYEFECKDGNHQVVLDPRIPALADALRERIGPFTPSSAYRNATHNKKVNGSPTSQHLYGKAIDVLTPRGLTVDQLAALGEAVGFTGIGTYSWGCHFDVRDVKNGRVHKFEMRK